MNSSSILSTRCCTRAAIALWLCLNLVAIVSAQTPPASEVTTNGISLAELLKKWEGTALNEVERLATSGDLTAQHYLGYCNVEGLRMPSNPQAGAAWYERALKGGYLPSANNLGLLHQRGLLGSKDRVQAIRYFSYAAERGLNLARVNLGFLYADEGRPTEALHVFQQAADQGSTEAMCKLYIYYWDGEGVPKDHAKAMQWLTKATEANNPYAQCLMGYRCETQVWVGEGKDKHLTPKKGFEAFRWYRKSAGQNWTAGLYHLGLCYLAGEATERNEARGLELIRATADMGMKLAILDLAKLYARGIGEPRNEQERPVALLHRAEAWEELQLRYEHGLGTSQDFVAAARCFSKLLLSESSYNHSPEDLAALVEFKSPRRSWAAPSTSSPDNHCHIYQPASDQNRLPTDDVLRALSLYLKSARGDGQSAERLGEKYLAGDGVGKSPSKAWAWFSVAAQNGSRTGPEKIARLEKQFTGSEAEAGREYLRGLRADLQQVSAVIAK